MKNTRKDQNIYDKLLLIKVVDLTTTKIFIESFYQVYLRGYLLKIFVIDHIIVILRETKLCIINRQVYLMYSKILTTFILHNNVKLGILKIVTIAKNILTHRYKGLILMYTYYTGKKNMKLASRQAAF